MDSLLKEDISPKFETLVNMQVTCTDIKLDENITSLELIDEFLKLDIMYPKEDFWDAVWTLIYLENKNIVLPPKGIEVKIFSAEKKRKIFFVHIKEAEKCGKLPTVISFINKVQLENFFIFK